MLYFVNIKNKYLLHLFHLITKQNIKIILNEMIAVNKWKGAERRQLVLSVPITNKQKLKL